MVVDESNKTDSNYGRHKTQSEKDLLFCRSVDKILSLPSVSFDKILSLHSVSFDKILSLPSVSFNEILSLQ